MTDDELELHCGRCGRRLTVRLSEIMTFRTIDCADCARLPPREWPAEGVARVPMMKTIVALKPR